MPLSQPNYVHAQGIGASAGGLTGGRGIASIARTGLGVYTVTLNVPVSSISTSSFFITCQNSGGVANGVWVNTSSFTVSLFTTGGAAFDSNFNVAVFD